MPFLPVFLWTDILIYLLFSVVLAAIFYIRRYPHLRAPWKLVFQRKRGVISIMILLCYVTIGLLDSVHFRQALNTEKVGDTQHYSTEVVTLLDLVLMPLRQQVEKTYSAPFATQLFVREMQQSDLGTLDYDYPKLLYGGSHLSKQQDKWFDIRNTIFLSSFLALLIWFLLSFSIAVFLARYHAMSLRQQIRGIRLGHLSYPIRTILFMLLVLLLFAFNLVGLSVDYHVLGTDKVGQDVLYQALKSVRTGLVIGTLTTLVMLPFALFMGIAAGYFKGWIDDVIQYIYTTLNSIPGVLLIAAAVLMMQVYMNNHPENFVTVAERADMRLLFLCIILGMTSWTGLCRILRGETLKLREAEYVLAARSLGVSSFSILHRHILPNLMHIVMIAIVLDFSGLVLAEAVLSYVGVGVDPSMISWGNMINSARLEMARDPVVWWSLTAAFFSMFILVLAANLFADVVRDAFDPRMQTVQ
ncbi:MAG: ABC transporter permease [Gammaproteobacteria bacterium]|nr:MAG: ABC transporter permease [Gammaproteobacteria bacterium]RKZ95454.1 MAG: ABC transporter permease [Gammaproteobacteria bacterium]RKZ96419.1 MAG: ABC transporter permease [Gammaproteobacteria bacterium]RLA01429.1 MAG: ABC transporter permease [Gammaproteobacteria bacterium]